MTDSSLAVNWMSYFPSFVLGVPGSKIVVAAITGCFTDVQLEFVSAFSNWTDEDPTFWPETSAVIADDTLAFWCFGLSLR